MHRDGRSGAAANAESSVQVALREKRDLLDRIVELHETRRFDGCPAPAHPQHEGTPAARPRRRRGRRPHPRYRHFRQRQLDRLADLRAEERQLIKTIRARVRELRAKRTELTDWIDSLPLQRCPVEGLPSSPDNFGTSATCPARRVHVHQGKDIVAATGTPSSPDVRRHGGRKPELPRRPSSTSTARPATSATLSFLPMASSGKCVRAT